MRRLLLLLGLLLLLTGRAGAVETLVQHAQNFGSTANISKAYTSNVTNGNFLLLACSVWNGNSGVDPTASDTLGLTWTKILEVGLNGSAVNKYIMYYTFATSTAADTVTCSQTTHSGMDIAIEEWSGVSNSGTVVTTSSMPGTCGLGPVDPGVITISSINYHMSWTKAAGTCGGMVAQIKGTGGDFVLLSWVFDVSTNHAWSVSTNGVKDEEVRNSTVGMSSALAHMASQGAAIANFVQSKSSTATSAATLAIAFPNSTVAAHTIIACVGIVGNTNLQTVSDGTNTYTLYKHLQTAGGGTSNATCWYAKNIAGGAVTVTFSTNNGNQPIDGTIAEYSGWSTSAPFDVTNGTVSPTSSCSGTPNCAVGSITTNFANEVLILFQYDPDQAADNFQLGGTPASGWSLKEQTVNLTTAGLNSAFWDNLQASTGTFAMTTSISPNTSGQLSLMIGGFVNAASTSGVRHKSVSY
jgi:hypothetical protein